MLFTIINGLATGMAVFLVAAGLTLIFGIVRILNFAHGAFFMIGAYIAFSLVGSNPSSLGSFLLASLAAGLAVGVLGLVADRTVLRRLRNVDEAYMLIATFALLLVCEGAVKLIWGVNYASINPPPALDDAIEIGPLFIPAYSAFLIVVGAVTFVVLDVTIHRTWIGKLLQSVATDKWMAGLMGINVPMVLTASVVASFFLAGLAGGLLLPNQTLSPVLGSTYLLLAFIAVIIGGLGSIRGAFIASALLGVMESASSTILPDMPGLATYAFVVVFLLVRPQGLVGSPLPAAPAATGHPERGSTALAHPGPVAWLLPIGCLLALLTLPVWSNQGIVFTAGLALVEAVFALSWNLLFGVTGLASFGHAAFFAIGAYLCAVGLKGGLPFLALLPGAAALGGLTAVLVGKVALRRSTGIHLAILTLALSEVLRVLISYSKALGREDGLPAIPRPMVRLGGMVLDLSIGSSYFLFLVAASGLLTLLLWVIVHGPFGRALKTIRQDPERAAFLGTNVNAYRLVAFTTSGAIASVAGALYAPWAQIVTPDSAHWIHSTQPMLASLLGGTYSFWGPVVGTVLFTAINYGTRTLVGLSEIVIGIVLLGIVLSAPDGVMGLMNRLLRSTARSEARLAAPPHPVRAPAGDR